MCLPTLQGVWFSEEARLEEAMKPQLRITLAENGIILRKYDLERQETEVIEYPENCGEKEGAEKVAYFCHRVLDWLLEYDADAQQFTNKHTGYGIGIGVKKR